VKAGAVGFGELPRSISPRGEATIRMNPCARPPLLLALADIAARHNMPIDLHMEAVPRDMPFRAPCRRSESGNLRETFRAGTSARAQSKRTHRVAHAAGT